MALTDSLSDLELPAQIQRSASAMLARSQGALLRCLPRRLGLWLAARHPDLIVVPEDGRAQLFRDVIGERQLIGVANPQAAEGAQVLERGEKRAWRSTILELPAHLVLTRRLVLPAQVRNNLHKMVAYELDRLTPFARDDIFHDARVVPEHSRGGMINVELAFCPRSELSPWLSYLGSLNRPVSKITWSGAWDDANLLPPEERPRPRRLPWMLSWMLFLLVFGLTVAVLLTPFWQRSNDQERLTRELRRTAVQAQEVSQLREALEKARVGSLTILEHKRDYPRMTDLMLELTQLLPDGTWVQTLNYRDGTVDIRGESTQATALISMLERGSGISNVTFRSPVMQIAASGAERFHIAFDYSSVAVE